MTGTLLPAAASRSWRLRIESSRNSSRNATTTPRSRPAPSATRRSVLGSGDVRCAGGEARVTTCTSCPASADANAERPAAGPARVASCALRPLRAVAAPVELGHAERDLLIERSDLLLECGDLRLQVLVERRRSAAAPAGGGRPRTRRCARSRSGRPGRDAAGRRDGDAAAGGARFGSRRHQRREMPAPQASVDGLALDDVGLVGDVTDRCRPASRRRVCPTLCTRWGG